MAARFRLVKYDNLPRYMYPIYIFRVIPGPTRHFFALLCSRSPAAWWVQRRGSHSRLRTRGAVAIGAGTSARHGETVKLFTRWKCREPWWDIPGLVNIYVTMENHQFLMRKSTISTGPFSIANCLFYQRVANFGTKKTTIMDKSSDLSFDLIGFYSDLMGFEWIQKIILKNAGKRSEVGAKDSMKRHCVQCAEVKQSSLQDLFACG